MSDSARALVIVEGARAEPRLFRKMAETFGIDAEIVVYGTNIYDLYRRLHEDEEGDDIDSGFLNIKDVLREMTDDENEKARLDGDFAYTYLVFDFDVQHHERDDGLDIDARVVKNLPMIKWMAGRFTDETDETAGKLYINYPMMEAFRDADSFFDDCYAKRKISLDEIPRYKEMVASRRLSGRDVAEYSDDQVIALVKMAAFKLSVMAGQGWAPLSYEGYRAESDASIILNTQIKSLSLCRELFVVNSSLFLPLDYKGAGLYAQIIG